MNKYINVRIESKNREKTLNSIYHDLRTKNVDHVRNDNKNYFYLNEEKKGFMTKESSKRGIIKSLRKSLDNFEKEHNDLYKKKYGRNIQKSRVNSFNIGVLTFSNTITEEIENGWIDKKEFIEKGIETIKDLMKEMNHKLIYVSCHFDEKTPHFHYTFTNYDSNGSSAKKTSKTLKKLQDIGAKRFNEWGYKRGQEKEITNDKHKTIREMHETEIKTLLETKKLLQAVELIPSLRLKMIKHRQNKSH